MKYITNPIIFISLLLIPYIVDAQQNTFGLVYAGNTNSLSEKTNGIVSFLPFFNKQFKKKNYETPKPFGLAFSSMIYKQEFISKDLRIKAETSIGQEIFAHGDSVSQQTTAGELKAYVKPNVWLFPFLNVYGIIGYTSGEIRPDLFIDGIVVEDLPGIGDYYIDTTFVLNDIIRYHGSTYGVGASFSYSYYPFTFNFDYHYTVTNPTDLEGKLYNHFLSPKIGYFISLKNKNLLLNTWVGAMYFNNNQSFTGELTVEEIAPELVPIFGEKAQYTGIIESKHDWNFLLGASMYIKHYHLVYAELGFVNRLQASIGYGFMF
jgi:hypothetical protein